MACKDGAVKLPTILKGSGLKGTREERNVKRSLIKDLELAEARKNQKREENLLARQTQLSSDIKIREIFKFREIVRRWHERGIYH